MSLVAIVNLAERLLNQTAEQQQNATANAKQVKNAASNAAGALSFEDQFTPSALNAPATSQEAGLFNVQRFTLFSAAADFLLSQSVAPTAAAAAPTETQGAEKVPTVTAASSATEAPAATQVPAVNLSSTTAVSVPPPAQPDTQVGNGRSQAAALNSTNQTQAPAATEEVQATQSIPQTAATAAQPNAQSQLQTLNNSLAALGLSAADIAIIDRIASLIQDFNPTAFTSLVYQLEALAQNNAPAKAVTPAPAKAAAASSGLTTQSNANNFQIQELVVRFSAVNETVQSGNPKTGGTAVQFSAFNLQVEGISLTFTNGNGQTVQVEAPQNANNTATTPTSPNVARARAAVA